MTTRIAMLLLALAGSVEAQYPSRDRTRSTVGTRFGDTTATAAPTPTAPGALRQLVCRGAEGIKIETVANPSPRSTAQVEVSLSYRRNPRPAGSGYEQLEPGTCSWNTVGDPTIPAEPGIVRFDLYPQGAEFIPDPTTLKQWLSNPRHHWSFYVDDRSNVSISHGAYGARFQAPAGDKPTVARSGSDRRERLRCRGGGSASFSQGKRIGPNLFAVTLSYKAASTAAGPIGKGLEPGTCAWADRTDAVAEPGSIEFTTPRNAQRNQAAVDSSPTAAERWPDLRTIPAYMTDPSHYWTFTVRLTNPDSALRHGAWIPTAPEAPDPQLPGPVANTPSGAGSPYTSTSPSGARTTVSLPGGGGSGIGDRYTPGAASDEAAVGTLIEAPLRVDRVNTVLDRFTIQFSGRPNASPTVLYSTEKPVREPSTGRYFFPSGVVQGSGAVEGGFRAEVSGGTAQGFRADYVAWSRLPPARGTTYHYIITIPAGVDVKEEQLTGQFTTLAQHARVVLTQIGISSTRHEDLSFVLFAAPAGGTPLSHKLGTELEWDAGYYPLEGQVLELPNAPDRIRVLVWGGDFAGVSGSQLLPGYDWNLQGKNGGASDENVARREFSIGVSPNERFLTIPFVIESYNGGNLMFTVHGRVEVTRR